jgi:hypothetical protein
MGLSIATVNRVDIEDETETEEREGQTTEE